jgi:demethylmenaquinone methyltransferase/2-methoxy-6-polyprenyl-1,4-benzoquinol methylase
MNLDGESLLVDDREILDEQIAYYRARAAEYDATSQPEGDPFAAHAAATFSAIERLIQGGNVLEIAAGTGQFTGVLAARADALTATDASPEMLERNAAKTGDARVRYTVADAFALEPTHAYDAVFFGFFLSHVPLSRFDAFWGVLDGQLRPAGQAVFVDEGRHELWDEDWIDEDAGLVRRTLTDGSIHRAVKVLWEPDALERRLSELGWRASVHPEGPFYWGNAIR